MVPCQIQKNPAAEIVFGDRVLIRELTIAANYFSMIIFLVWTNDPAANL